MFTQTKTRTAQLATPAYSPRSLLSFLRDAMALRRSRVALGKLSAAQLDDIGVSPDQATQEANRPIWDAPHHWRA